MAHGPSEPQQRILRLLADREESPLPPTYREIARTLGWRSVGTVRSHLQQLAEAGLVELPEGRARGLSLTWAGRHLVEGPAPASGDPARLGAVLEHLAPYAEKRSYPAGRLLWRQGDPGKMAVLLESGRVRTYRSRPSGRRVPYYDFGPGDVFGLLPLIDGGPYPADAEVVEPAVADVVPRSALRTALAQDPQLSQILLSSLGQRLRESLDRIRDLSEHDATPRVARAILHLAEEGGGPGGATVVELHTTAAELAEELGMTAPTLSRALTRLVGMGALHRLGPRSYQITHLEVLQGAAASEDW